MKIINHCRIAKEKNNSLTRRSFLQKASVISGVGLLTPSFKIIPNPMLHQKMTYDDISIAQWALVNEIRSGEWTNLDFPRIAREDFGLNGIEFVNTLFDVPTANYLKQLKSNADDHGVTMILIMVDAEGDGCEPTQNRESNLQSIIANGLTLPNISVVIQYEPIVAGPKMLIQMKP